MVIHFWSKKKLKQRFFTLICYEKLSEQQHIKNPYQQKICLVYKDRGRTFPKFRVSRNKNLPKITFTRKISQYLYIIMQLLATYYVPTAYFLHLVSSTEMCSYVQFLPNLHCTCMYVCTYIRVDKKKRITPILTKLTYECR